ncbi:hypothetical protein [Streptomyces sp. NPDC102437]|uniref:hypothetical protein n=1 Tax=Streptomyces sp. NPDC102437 TaxID=3366175 RepID=UPI00380B6012
MEMQRQVRALTDRAEITDLMDRYLRSLDDGAFDEEWARLPDELAPASAAQCCDREGSPVSVDAKCSMK